MGGILSLPEASFFISEKYLQRDHAAQPFRGCNLRLYLVVLNDVSDGVEFDRKRRKPFHIITAACVMAKLLSQSRGYTLIIRHGKDPEKGVTRCE